MLQTPGDEQKYELGNGWTLTVIRPQGPMTARDDLHFVLTAGRVEKWVTYIQIAELVGMLQQAVRAHGPALQALSTRRPRYVTLSDYGIRDGRSALPNGCFDFGPDSTNHKGELTTTGGEEEAHAFADPIKMGILRVRLEEIQAPGEI